MSRTSHKKQEAWERKDCYSSSAVWGLDWTLFCFCFLPKDRLLHSPSWPKTYYIAQAGLYSTLCSLLLQSPECWDQSLHHLAKLLSCCSHSLVRLSRQDSEDLSIWGSRELEFRHLLPCSLNIYRIFILGNGPGSWTKPDKYSTTKLYPIPIYLKLAFHLLSK